MLLVSPHSAPRPPLPLLRIRQPERPLLRPLLLLTPPTIAEVRVEGAPERPEYAREVRVRERVGGRGGAGRGDESDFAEVEEEAGEEDGGEPVRGLGLGLGRGGLGPGEGKGWGRE